MIDGFSDRLGVALKRKKMTQKELAKTIGSSTTSVGNYFSGAINPSAMIVIKLAKALGVSADWLLGLSDLMEVPTTAVTRSESGRKVKTVYVRKTVVVTKDMTPEDELLFACSYTGLSPEAVRALNRSRGLKFEWRRCER